MRKHLLSSAALLVMIVLAFGSADTSNVNDVGSSSPSSGSDPESMVAPIVHKMKESVSVGYTSYVVWKVWWSDRLSANEFLDQRPDASYLFIELSVRNDDTQPRSIPPLTLIDENNAEYQASPNAWAVDRSIGVLDSLNPSVTKQGLVIFDVPRNHVYQLKISGGYWSGQNSLIELIDRDAEQKELLSQQEVEELKQRKAQQAKAAEFEAIDGVDERVERLKQRRLDLEARQKEREAQLAAEEDANFRTWTSANAKHVTEAKLLSFANGEVTLEKRDGKTTKVHQDKLSDADREYIEDWRSER